MYCGSFGYADDVALVSPTKHSLRHMLQICDSFALEFRLAFNQEKSRYLMLSPSTSRSQRPTGVPWRGGLVDHCKQEIHLGNIIGPNSNLTENVIRKAVSDLYIRFNRLNTHFRNIDPDVKYQLFKPLCMSVYGSQLWDFSSRHCEKFYTAWRKSIRTLLDVPYRTHSALLPLLVDDLPVDMQLHKRFLKFFFSCVHSSNEVISMCSFLALRGSGSNAAKSIEFLCTLYGFPSVIFARSTSVFDIFQYIHYQPSDIDARNANAISSV